jgi:multidrug resistance efflux pump
LRPDGRRVLDDQHDGKARGNRSLDAGESTRKSGRRTTLIVVAIGAVLFFYTVVADRVTPYTVQALVQAYLVRIAPQVDGRVIEVGVGTDQRVKAGTVLLRLEPEQ